MATANVVRHVSGLIPGDCHKVGQHHDDNDDHTETRHSAGRVSCRFRQSVSGNKPSPSGKRYMREVTREDLLTGAVRAVVFGGWGNGTRQRDAMPQVK